MVMEDVSKTRIYGENVDIDGSQVKKLYNNRSERNGNRPVDAPTVLCSDTDPGNIEAWTREELERWFPSFRLDGGSVVLEIGFGTGRMSKYITPVAAEYVGIDYAESFYDTFRKREDILKKENTQLFNLSLEQFTEEYQERFRGKFNRVFLSGGVFMYINDRAAKKCVEQLAGMLQKSCIIYVSEPVALEKRLTLNSFYSEAIQDHYSAIYRTVGEYTDLFSPFLEHGFALKTCGEFFENDFKKMKETKQWIFLMERTDREEQE